jgi:hypothetical protein
MARDTVFGAGRIYKDSRDADAARAQRAAASLQHQTPPPWADGPDQPPPVSGDVPPPPGGQQPDLKIVDDAPAADKAAPQPQQPRRPLTTVGVQTGPPQPQPEPEPDPGRDWTEIISTVMELVGITAVSVGFGMWINPWLGVILAGIALVVLGVASSSRFSR